MPLRDVLGRALGRRSGSVTQSAAALAAPPILGARPRLFLHIGMAKTGTTSIQTFAWENRARLAEAGLSYPEFGAVVGAHHRLSPFIPPSLADAWTYEPIEEWAPALARLARGPVVLSSELISHAEPRLIQRMAAALQPHFDTRIIVYVRRIDAHVMAAYNQQVKVGHQTRPIQDVVGPLFGQLRIDRLLKPWIASFGAEQVLVRPFERQAFANGDIRRDFCTVLGLDWRDDFQVPTGNPNARLARDALEYKRLLNVLVPDPALSGAFIQPLLDYSARVGTASTAIFHAADLLPGVTLQAMIDRLTPFYRKVARQSLGRSDGVLFSAPLPDTAGVWQPLHLGGDQIAAITAAIATPELSAILSEARQSARRKGDLQRLTISARFPGQ